MLNVKEIRKKMNSSEKYLKRLLDEGKRTPIDPDGSFELKLPPWYDAERFLSGQKIYQKYTVPFYSGMLLGLTSIFYIPSILKVLMCTGKSSTPYHTYQRYVKTIHHMITWYTSDLRPGSLSWQSIEKVRSKHIAARKLTETNHAGVIISQFDMAMTQFGFIGYILLQPKRLGIHLDDDTILEDSAHFWRVLGYMMGIRDEFNICDNSLAETRRRLQIVLEQIFRPAMENPLPQVRDMVTAVTKGLWYFNIVCYGAVVDFMAKRLAGCRNFQYPGDMIRDEVTKQEAANIVYFKLGIIERYCIWLFVLVHETIYRFDLGLLLAKVLINLSEWLSYNLPIGAIWKFGGKAVYIRIFHEKETVVQFD